MLQGVFLAVGTILYSSSKYLKNKQSKTKKKTDDVSIFRTMMHENRFYWYGEGMNWLLERF